MVGPWNKTNPGVPCDCGDAGCLFDVVSQLLVLLLLVLLLLVVMFTGLEPEQQLGHFARHRYRKIGVLVRVVHLWVGWLAAVRAVLHAALLAPAMLPAVLPAVLPARQ